MIEPVSIELGAWYDDAVVAALFRLGPETLANARRSGALRFVRHGHRTLYRGDWLHDWLSDHARREVGRAE